MLQQCRSCSFDGLSAVSSGSEFEKLNNAIVRASSRGGVWYTLANDWQDRAVEERTWKQAVPPLWSSLMEEFWAKYSQLYRVEKNRSGLANPYDIAPTGIPGALRDLWAPTVSTAQAAQKAAQEASAQASAALKELQNKAAAKVQEAIRDAGREAAKGAAEETEKQATNRGVYWFSFGLLGLLGYQMYRRGQIV